MDDKTESTAPTYHGILRNWRRIENEQIGGVQYVGHLFAHRYGGIKDGTTFRTGVIASGPDKHGVVVNTCGAKFMLDTHKELN
jgi:hypothetical protein